MMRVSMLPVAAAVVLGLGAATLPAAGAGYEVPVLERAEIAARGERGGTVRLRGLDVTFDFDSTSNTIGYTSWCEGLRYPEGAWPDNCRVKLSGPAIAQLYAARSEPRRYQRRYQLECRPYCRLFDWEGNELTDELRVLESAEIAARGERGGTARLRGLDITFDFDSTSNTIGYTSWCEGLRYPEAGLRYPENAWPGNCRVKLTGPAIDLIGATSDWNSSPFRDVTVECSPGCEFRSKRER